MPDMAPDAPEKVADPRKKAAQSGSVSARPTPLGIYDKPKPAGITEIEVVAVTLSAVWLVGAAIFFLLQPEDPNPQEG